MNNPPKILHIAPQNFAGMPIDFVNMHRSFGIDSRLITIYKNTLDFEEDISMNLPISSGKLAKKWRDSKIDELKYYKPKNFLESAFFKLRDFKNKGKITSYINNYNLFEYDIYHFDGGMDLFRDLRFAKELKKRGKKIVCCYFGSDLRTRGIFKDLDDMSDLNLTVEFDHLQLYKDLNYVFFPFNLKNYEYLFKFNSKIKIIHSPTNRVFKGTYKILKVIEELKKEKDFEFLLVENMERDKLLKLKKECNLAIDQVGGEMGGTGYGKNSIENLAMGIPTITEFTDDYLKFIPENPFLTCNINTLKETLIKIIDNPMLLKSYSEVGRKWVEKYHSFESVNAKLMDLYKKKGIIVE